MILLQKGEVKIDLCISNDSFTGEEDIIKVVASNNLVAEISYAEISLRLIKPVTEFLWKDSVFPYSPQLMDEEEESSVLGIDVHTGELSTLYTPEDDWFKVFSLDVSKDGKYLLISIVGEEPDTPNCVIIDSQDGKPVEFNTEDIWYEGYGDGFKWGDNNSEIYVINDMESSETKVEVNWEEHRISPIS